MQTQPKRIRAKNVVYFSPTQLGESRVLCDLQEIEGFALNIEWPRRRMVAPFMWGHKAAYRTAQHAFQAMRANDLPSAREFELRGVFDDYSVLEKWPMAKGLHDTRNIRDPKLEKAGMIGVVAMLAGDVAVERARAVWGLEMGRRWDESDTCRLWEIILKAKFPLGSDQATYLVSTAPRYLLNHNANATENSRQYGRFDAQTKRLVGANMAGVFLMTLRKDLQDEQPRPPPKAPCIIVTTTDASSYYPAPEAASEREDAEQLWRALLCDCD